jgi:hypothetical protein
MGKGQDGIRMGAGGRVRAAVMKTSESPEKGRTLSTAHLMSERDIVAAMSSSQRRAYERADAAHRKAMLRKARRR